MCLIREAGGKETDFYRCITGPQPLQPSQLRITIYLDFFPPATGMCGICFLVFTGTKQKNEAAGGFLATVITWQQSTDAALFAWVPQRQHSGSRSSRSRYLFGQHFSCSNHPCTSILAPDVVSCHFLTKLQSVSSALLARVSSPVKPPPPRLTPDLWHFPFCFVFRLL